MMWPRYDRYELEGSMPRRSRKMLIIFGRRKFLETHWMKYMNAASGKHEFGLTQQEQCWPKKRLKSDKRKNMAFS